MEGSVIDLGAKTAVELAGIRQIFQKTDELYRLYREALLNHEAQQNQPRPTEWIPISEH